MTVWFFGSRLVVVLWIFGEHVWKMRVTELFKSDLYLLRYFGHLVVLDFYSIVYFRRCCSYESVFYG